jgi:predicted NBD/HSP70 family sugar kinase
MGPGAALVEQLGQSPVRGFTHARILRAIALQVGRGVRRELAEELIISPGTVSKSVAQLSDLKLVQEDRRGLALGPGRPLMPLTLKQHFAIAGVAIVSNDGKPYEFVGTVIYIDGTPLPGFETVHRRKIKDEASSELCRFAQDLVDLANLGDASLLGCGVSIAGHVDNNIIKSAFSTEWGRNKEGWGDLKTQIEKCIQLPVVLDNDVASLAIRNNLTPGDDNPLDAYYALLAPIDRGVGGAIVLRGQTWPGAHGMAGEVGHIPAPGITSLCNLPDDSPDSEPIKQFIAPECQCGKPAHIEAFAAPKSIEKRALDNKLVDSIRSVDELAARPRSEREVGLLFYQGGLALGRAIVSIVNLIDPTYIVLYLPAGLNQTNEYLAGRYYRIGLTDEMDNNAFYKKASDRDYLKIRTTDDREMQERLAVAAAYLVFRDLIRKIRDISGSRQSR